MSQSKKLDSNDANVIYSPGLWLRIYNLTTGIVFLLLSSRVVLYSNLTVNTTIDLMALGILILGFSRFVHALYGDKSNKNIVMIRIGIGSLMIVVSFIILFMSKLSADRVFVIIGIVLILQGITRILLAKNQYWLNGWPQYTLYILGLMNIVIGLVSFIPDQINLETNSDILNLLGVGFLIAGLSRIILGITPAYRKDSESSLMIY